MKSLAILAIVGLALTLRIGALLAWRTLPPPDETRSFLEQADNVVLGVGARRLDDGQWRAQRAEPDRLAGWFTGSGKPPMFSGLVGLTVALGRELKIDARKMESATWLSLAAGMWLLLPAWKMLRRVGDERLALAGLALIAALPAMVEMSARPLPDSLHAALFLFAIAGLIAGVARPGLESILAGGIAAGLAFVARAEAVVLAPAGILILASAAAARRITWSYALRGAGLFMVGLLASAGPYVWLASRAAGQLSITRDDMSVDRLLALLTPLLAMGVIFLLARRRPRALAGAVAVLAALSTAASVWMIILTASAGV